MEAHIYRQAFTPDYLKPRWSIQTAGGVSFKMQDDCLIVWGSGITTITDQNGDVIYPHAPVAFVHDAAFVVDSKKDGPMQVMFQSGQ